MGKIGIRAKLVILVICTAFIPLLGVGIGFYWLASHSIQRSVIDQSSTMIDNLVTELEAAIRERITQAEFLASNQLVVDVLRRTEEVVELEAILRPFLIGNRLVFVRLIFCDKEGNLITELSKNGFGDATKDNRIAAVARLLARADYEMRMPQDMHIAIKGPGVKTHRDGRYEHIIRITLPIEEFSTGQAVGWLVADLQLDAFLMQGSFYSLMRHRKLTIVAQDLVVAASERKTLGQSTAVLFDKDVDLKTATQGVLHEIDETQVVYSLVDGLDWLVFDWVSLRDFTEGPRQTTVYGLLATVIIALSSVCIMLAIVGRITGRVRRITAAAEGLAAGDLTQRITTSSADETGRLANSFNNMAASLEENVGQLKAFNDELEDRVARRTAELEKANKIVKAHNALLEHELETAHTMQMELMPASAPQLEGFDIAGICRPATHVGGDFFQYFPLSDGRLVLAIADVTGHGMEAAIPTVLFSGILDNEMKNETSPEVHFSHLNRSLHRTLNRRTFVCCTMGELDPVQHRIRLTNGGCPYPYHYRASTGKITELCLDALPLGLRQESEYPVIEVDLAPGDLLIFCSDGIIEAQQTEEEMFGFERTASVIAQACKDSTSAALVIEHLMHEVDTFTGTSEQQDDQTIVVLRVAE